MKKIIATIWILIFVLAACGREEGGNGVEAQSAIKAAAPTSTPTPEPTPTPLPAELSVSVINPLDDSGIAGAQLDIKDTRGETVSSVSTNEAGLAEAELISGEEYTLIASMEGFHSREYIFEAQPGENEKRILLVPVSVGNDAYVLLEWDGSQDLDLCAFNPRKREYVFFGSPEDFEGDYLIADNDSAQGYEMLCLRNVLAERAKTVYVADSAAAATGELSDMEKDGVRISAWDNLGLVYACEAAPKEKGAVWEAFYFFGGEAVTNQEKYATDYSDYGWLTEATSKL